MFSVFAEERRKSTPRCWLASHDVCYFSEELHAVFSVFAEERRKSTPRCWLASYSVCYFSEKLHAVFQDAGWPVMMCVIPPNKL